MSSSKIPLMPFWQMVRFQFRRGWNEIPEVMGASCLAFSALCAYGVYFKFSTPTANNHRYKHHNIIMRPDDPKLSRVRRFENSPEITFK